jgi:hypothetical protein
VSTTRKTLSLILAAASLVLAAAGSANAADPLVGQWHLDESRLEPGNIVTTYATPDSSGNNLHLYTRNTPPQIVNDGRFGKALSGYNIGRLSTAQPSAKLQQQRLTVKAWIRHAGYPGGLQYIVGQGDDGISCSAASWALYTGANIDDGMRFYILPTGSPFAISSPAAPYSVWDGEWHLITATFDGSAVRLYVDGVQSGAGTPAAGATINYGLSGKSFYVDGYPDVGCGSGDFFGDIDEVRVYDRALSGSEIQRISDFGGTNPPPFVPDPPVIHTRYADQTTPTSARIVGTIDNRGEPLPYRVEYGKTTAYGHNSATANAPGAIGERPVALTIGGLDPATEYHARLVSASTERAAVGEDITFHTGGLPRLRFTEPKARAAESGGAKQVTVELAGTATQPVTVNYLTTDGTATAGADYTETSGEITFAAGERFKTISIPVTDDGKVEPDETVIVSLSSPSANAELAEHHVELTIADDDQAPKTTITATPDNPAGSEQAIVSVVGVGRTSTGAPIETRCVVNPAATPAGFDDLPAACPLLRSDTGFTTPGEFNIYAASRDAAGNTEPLVTRRVVILDQPDTMIDEGPSGDVWNPKARFTFSSSIPDATFQCRIDDGGFTPCWTPHTTGELAPGPHRFEVRAVGPAGGVDPTPVRREFTVNGPTTLRVPQCQTQVDAVFGPGYHVDGCVIGKRPESCAPNMYKGACNEPSFCPLFARCVWTTQTCPVGTLCTVTTSGAFYHADKNVDWHLTVLAEIGIVHDFGRENRYENATCFVRDRDRCHQHVSVTAIGDGRPILGRCLAGWGPYLPRDPKPGHGNYRRIECDVSVQIERAPVLAIVPVFTGLQVLAPSAGLLTIAPRIVGGSSGAVAAAAPRIAPVRQQVTKEGPVGVKLQLNKAAKRLLARKGKLRVAVSSTFTPTSGERITRTTRVTIRAPRKAPPCRTSGDAGCKAAPTSR